jgi:glutathione S-transferase
MINLYTTERTYPYGVLRSTNSSKVKVVLEEKGLAYRTQNLRPGDLWKKPPELLEKHPLGKVPYIDDGDLTVFDSTVINEYIEEAYPNPPLMPQGAQAKAKVRMLENYADEAILTGFLPLIWMPWWTPEDQRDSEAMERGRIGMREKVLPYVESVLEVSQSTGGNVGDASFLCGKFSLADAPYMAMAMVFEVDEFDVSEFPGVARYLEKLRRRSSYQAISPRTPLPE